MGDVVKPPTKYKTYLAQMPGEQNVQLLEDKDAARLTGLTGNQLAELLTPLTPVLYFRLAEVLALRDRIRGAKNGA